jgi:hypothetical protein
MEFFLVKAEAQTSINSHRKAIFWDGWLMSENSCHKRNNCCPNTATGNVKDTEA